MSIILFNPEKGKPLYKETRLKACGAQIELRTHINIAEAQSIGFGLRNKQDSLKVINTYQKEVITREQMVNNWNVTINIQTD